ncbi:MAG: carboxymuconolactone decarboxylase family protein [Candidatus Sericytochromatia bacterium]|nr:carboxymuconolactone decarboxylase family protein [Candidatus Sericytochromatia bacterium]
MTLTLEDLLEVLRQQVPDLWRNWQSVIDREDSPLSLACRRGLVLACALTQREPSLLGVLLQTGEEWLSHETRLDAKNAASLMAMNNVFYRFRHEVPHPGYTTSSARLRMTRLLQPEGKKIDVELWATALSTLNGCGACTRAHEDKARQLGATEEQVLEAIRIAAVVAGISVALSDLAVDLPAVRS